MTTLSMGRKTQPTNYLITYRSAYGAWGKQVAWSDVTAVDRVMC